MCLIAWNWQPQSATPLLLMANRDEYYARPARPLHWWPDGQLLAGQDLQAGGTWLGVDRQGRMAALTNYRQAGEDTRLWPSRGALVTQFLQGQRNAPDYLAALLQQGLDYKPFNLLVFDGQQLLGLESRRARIRHLAPGIGAVSNADFDTPWPKLLRWKQGLQQQGAAAAATPQCLLPLMHDTLPAAEAELPQTGVAPALERLLSAPFIRSPAYGTRACSVLMLGRSRVWFLEQSHGPQGLLSTTQETFALTTAAGA